MPELSSIHFIITTIIAIWVSITAYMQYRQGKNDKTLEREALYVQEIQKLNVEVQVLKERVSNQVNIIKEISHAVERIDEKL